MWFYFYRGASTSIPNLSLRVNLLRIAMVCPVWSCCVLTPCQEPADKAMGGAGRVP